jgi:hypothetical protein
MTEIYGHGNVDLGYAQRGSWGPGVVALGVVRHAIYLGTHGYMAVNTGYVPGVRPSSFILELRLRRALNFLIIYLELFDAAGRWIERLVVGETFRSTCFQCNPYGGEEHRPTYPK